MLCALPCCRGGKSETRPIRDSGRRNDKEREIGERACAIEERSNGFKPRSDEEKLLESGKSKVTSRG